MHNRERRAGGFDNLLAKYGGKPAAGGGRKMLRDAGAAAADEEASMEASPGKKAKGARKSR
jgi:hypothetical protein